MAIITNVLSTEPAVLYSSLGNSVVSTAYFCNLDSSARTFNLFLLPNGETMTGNHTIYHTIQVASHDTFVIDMEKIVLGNGDAIVANASANSAITSTVSYVGI